MAKVKSLLKQVEELVGKMELPSFSLPFLGPSYSLMKKRRIMIVCGFEWSIDVSLFRDKTLAKYSETYYKDPESLIMDPQALRANPYRLESDRFDLTSVLEGVDKKLSVNDVIVHRFVPYPLIRERGGEEDDGGNLIDGSFPEWVYEKSVELFEGIVDICHPTHVLIRSSLCSYQMDAAFRQFRRESLQTFFDRRYIVPAYENDVLEWESLPPVGDPSEIVPSCASDIFADVELARRVLDDSSLKPALYWDDTKIKCYGCNERVFNSFRKNPTLAREKLLDETCPDSIKEDLIRPFETLKYGRILYAMPGVITSCYSITEKDWKSSFLFLKAHENNVKSVANILKKKRDVLGRAKIRELAVYSYYALNNLSRKLHVSLHSEQLAEIRRYI